MQQYGGATYSNNSKLEERGCFVEMGRPGRELIHWRPSGSWTNKGQRKGERHVRGENYDLCERWYGGLKRLCNE